MIIEIRRAGFVNKGAELMLHAALQKTRELFPEATYVMAPTPRKGNQPYEKFTKLGFYPKAWLWRHGIQWGNLASLVPRQLREMYGVILDKDVDVVIDAAGFTYSDQWGTDSSAELAQSSERWSRNNTFTVLLPQAFGPYEIRKNKNNVKKFTENIDLIFARDRVSYNYLTDISGEQNNIRIYPDFTNLIEGIIPQEFNKNENFCVIPNARMLDKTGGKTSNQYIPFLIECTKYLVERGKNVFILIHEGKDDLELAEKISVATGGTIIIREEDPLKIKGILGTCEGTIGSRFHGLVSALSQGVPSLATGWSHKYQMLFEDYDFADGLIEITTDKEEIKKKLDLIIDPVSSRDIKARLLRESERLKKLSLEMWEMVFTGISARIK